VIVTGYHKRSIEDHFDYLSADLRKNLKDAGKTELLESVKEISDLANFIYIRQKGPYGNGTPLLNAEHIIGNEPFIYTWSDDFIRSEPSRFKQMIAKYEELGGPILSCVRLTEDDQYDRYGVVAGREIQPGVIEMETIIEKPGKAQAPSDLASVSGYLLTPDIFGYLKKSVEQLNQGEEFYVQPAMRLAIEDGQKLYACEISNSKYYDTGNKLEYLKTVVDFGINHEELGEDFKAYLRGLQL
jgi:UTP--glucose-1-phosphate uridylyltransferase